MTGFQKWVMGLIGLRPELYDLPNPLERYDVRFVFMEWEVDKALKENADVCQFLYWYQKKIRPKDMALELIKGYDFKKARGE